MTASDPDIALSIETTRRGFTELTFLQRGGPTAGQHVDWMCSAQRLCGDDCDEIIEACDEFPLCPPSTVGEDRYPGHRKGDMRKIGLTPRTEWIFGLISDVATEAARVASGLDLTEINRAPQYMEYRPGLGQFDWHNDYSHGLPMAPRKLTVILQLSSPEDYEGGRLQIFGAEIEDMPRERGTVIVFPSFLFHRVTPVTKGLRRALVSWIAGPRIT